MASRRYDYVGPAEVRRSALAASPPGTPIGSVADLLVWITEHTDEVEADGAVIATFTIGTDGVLSLAPRRSEHVACAAGGPVLSAGEAAFSADGELREITNQSTGFCPGPESWPAVAAALRAVGVTPPDGFTTVVVFRFCPGCGERNLVKDGWFVCDLCGADLPVDG